ncbi:MAG TPA: AMP-binding protein, partial [Spirochaetia bacterium]|nr:AMP-binding protein [Spirochaetia bacterium]
MWTLGEIFTRNAKLYPDKGLIFDGQKLAYRDLNLRVNRLVSAMAARGIGKGDGVAVLSKNCNEYMEAYGLAEKGGIVLVPLNWRLVARELKFMLADAGAKALIVAPEYTPVIDTIREDLSDVGIYISLHSRVPGYEFYEDVLNQGVPDEPDVAIDSDDVAYIIYSSGTTGLPKGIMLTHGGQLDCAVHQLAEMRSGEYSVHLAVLPLFHSGGKSSTLSHFFRGCTIVIMREFDPREVLETIQREKVTVTQVVPS